MPEPAHKRQLTLTVFATPLMTPTMALGLSTCFSMFELRETGDSRSEHWQANVGNLGNDKIWWFRGHWRKFGKIVKG